MRYSITIIFSWWLVFQVIAQSPQSFKYQTTVRDNSGQLMANKLVAFRIGILAGSSTANPIYAERYSIATNDFGIANLNIGQGVALQGIFSSIDWSNGPFFLKIEIDANNGTNYSFMGTSQLLSVPFALYAAKSANAADDNDKDSTNELQNLSLIGSKLQLSKANSVTLDTDTSNEIQQLNLTNNQITLSKAGGSIDLTPYKDNVDSQRLVLTGNVLQITKGNSVFLNDVDSINELQQISLAGDSLKLNNGGGYVDLAKYATDTQSLILQGNTLSISRGNTILLSGAVDLDSDPTNEIQRLKFKNDSLSLSIDTTSYRIASVENVAISKYQYATAAGNNAINLSADNTIRSYAAGMILNFKAVGTNTGSVTINLNGLGSKLLYKNVSDTLTAGDIKTNQMVSIMYDGINFQFVNVPYSKLSENANKLQNNSTGGLVPVGTSIASDSLMNIAGYELKEVIRTQASIEPFITNIANCNFAVYGDSMYLDTSILNLITLERYPKPNLEFTNKTSVLIGNHIYIIRANYTTNGISGTEAIFRYNKITNQLITTNAALPSTIGSSSASNIYIEILSANNNIYIFRKYWTQISSQSRFRYELLYYSIHQDTIYMIDSFTHLTLNYDAKCISDGKNIYIYSSSGSPTVLNPLKKFSDTTSVSTSVPLPVTIYNSSCCYLPFRVGDQIFANSHLYNNNTNSWIKIGNIDCRQCPLFVKDNQAYFVRSISGSSQLYLSFIQHNLVDNMIFQGVQDPSFNIFTFNEQHYGISKSGDIYFCSVSPTWIVKFRPSKTKYIYSKL